MGVEVEVDVVTITRKRVSIPETCPNCESDLREKNALHAWVHGDAIRKAHVEKSILEEDTPPENFDEGGVLEYQCNVCDRVLAEGGLRGGMLMEPQGLPACVLSMGCETDRAMRSVARLERQPNRQRMDFLKEQAVVVGCLAAGRIFAKRAPTTHEGEQYIQVTRAQLAGMIAIGALNAWQTAPEDVYDPETGLTGEDTE